MTIETMSNENNQAQTDDVARSWVKGVHWVMTIDKDNSRHMIVCGRTCQRDYFVNWQGGKPTVTDNNAFWSSRGQTVSSAELKASGYKRNKGSFMYNTITREISFHDM